MSDPNGHLPVSKDDTNPFGIPAVRPSRRRRRWGWLLASLGVALLAVAGLWWLRSSPQPKPPAVAAAPRPAPTPAPLAAAPVPALTQVQAQLTVNEIAAREEIAYRQGQKLAELLRRYAACGGTALVGFDLAAPVEVSERILQQAAAVEKEPQKTRIFGQMRPLLAEIGQLREQIRRLESTLGAPRLIRGGETHSQVVREYLTAVRKLTPEAVAERMRKVPLFDPLLPGNKVWNLWLDEGFFSFVTQGDARLPASEVLRQSQQRQRVEKEAALRLLNSLHYMVDTRARLIEKGILSSKFLRSTQLDNVDPGQFRRAIDLRQKQAIFLSARSLGLERIERVTLFPREFQAGRDYSLRIAADQLSALVHLLAVERFRGQRLVIAVE